MLKIVQGIKRLEVRQGSLEERSKGLRTFPQILGEK